MLLYTEKRGRSKPVEFSTDPIDLSDIKQEFSRIKTDVLDNFHVDVKEQYALILQKLKSLKFAVDQYAATSRVRYKELKEAGDSEELASFRPTTPPNVRILMR